MITKIKTFAIMALLVMTAASCSKDEDTTTQPAANNDSVYMGSWEGVFTGGDNGTWSMEVDKEAKFTGSFTSGNTGTTYPFTGSFDSKGEISTTIDVDGIILDFDGNGSADGKTANGTWGNSAANISGAWTGAKK